MEDGGDGAAVGLNGYGRPPSGLVEGVHEDGANAQDEDGGGDGPWEPDKPAVQPKNPIGVKGTTVLPGGGELLSLTKVLSLNASCLMESTGRRLKEFAILVKGMKEKPDIIAVTELGGYSGVISIKSKMHGPLAGYGVASSQRPQGSGTKQAGAGILLLYKREKFRCEDLPLPDVSQGPLLSGYVRTFCLWRKQTPSVPPLVNVRVSRECST